MSETPSAGFSPAYNELDALLTKTTPRRSYRGLVIGVAWVVSAAFATYKFTELREQLRQKPRVHILERAAFDSLKKTVDVLTQRVDAAAPSHSELDSLVAAITDLQVRRERASEYMVGIENRLNEIPPVVFSTTHTDVDGACIVARVYDHDSKKDEYTNGKNVLLCGQVRR